MWLTSHPNVTDQKPPHRRRCRVTQTRQLRRCTGRSRILLAICMPTSPFSSNGTPACTLTYVPSPLGVVPYTDDLQRTPRSHNCPSWCHHRTTRSLREGGVCGIISTIELQSSICSIVLSTLPWDGVSLNIEGDSNTLLAVCVGGATDNASALDVAMFFHFPRWITTKPANSLIDWRGVEPRRRRRGGQERRQSLRRRKSRC